MVVLCNTDDHSAQLLTIPEGISKIVVSQKSSYHMILRVAEFPTTHISQNSSYTYIDIIRDIMASFCNIVPHIVKNKISLVPLKVSKCLTLAQH